MSELKLKKIPGESLGPEVYERDAKVIYEVLQELPVGTFERLQELVVDGLED